jgi:hypothetical protein
MYWGYVKDSAQKSQRSLSLDRCGHSNCLVVVLNLTCKKTVTRQIILCCLTAALSLVLLD